MVKDKTNSDSSLTKKKLLDLFFERSGMIKNSDERHFQAVKHFLKSQVPMKKPLETMKKVLFS